MPNRKTFGTVLADVRYLVIAWLLLAVYRLSLTIWPYRAVSRLLPPPRVAPAPAWAIARTRWAISAAAPAAFRSTCLPQAMAANALLSLQGYASIIRVGVRRGDQGQVQAHAWVLAGGVVVVGDDGERLDSFSPLLDIGTVR